MWRGTVQPLVSPPISIPLFLQNNNNNMIIHIGQHEQAPQSTPPIPTARHGWTIGTNHNHQQNQDSKEEVVWISLQLC
jgi:hypothetical protein